MNNNRKKYVQINNDTFSDKIFALLDNVQNDEEKDIEELMNYSGRCFQVYVGIVNHIHFCYGIFTHIQTLLKHIHAYSAKFSILYNPRIFATLPYAEPWHN